MVRQAGLRGRGTAGTKARRWAWVWCVLEAGRGQRSVEVDSEGEGGLGCAGEAGGGQIPQGLGLRTPCALTRFMRGATSSGCCVGSGQDRGQKGGQEDAAVVRVGDGGASAAMLAEEREGAAGTVVV